MQFFKNGDSRRRLRFRSLAPWFIAGAVLLVFIAAFAVHRSRRAPAPQPVSYSTMLSDLAARRVVSLEIEPGREIRGRWRSTAKDSLFRVVYTSPAFDEVLRRQGLLEGTWCLDPHESMSPGQSEEIDRVYRAYPHLHDDEFVAQHRDEWLR